MASARLRSFREYVADKLADDFVYLMDTTAAAEKLAKTSQHKRMAIRLAIEAHFELYVREQGLVEFHGSQLVIVDRVEQVKNAQHPELTTQVVTGIAVIYDEYFKKLGADSKSLLKHLPSPEKLELRLKELKEV